MILTDTRLREQRLDLHVISLEAEFGMTDNRPTSSTHDHVPISLDMISQPNK